MAKTYRSKYRDWMMTYFSAHPDALLRAHEIHARMNAEGMAVNLVTVYRNLDRLTEDGVLSRRKIPETDESCYQYLSPDMACDHHLHLYCSRCGKVIHLNCGFMDEISEHLMREHGFLLDCHESMLVGLCEDCRMKQGVPGGN